MAQKTLEETYHATRETDFNEAFWNKFVGDVGSRIRALDSIRMDWETVSQQGIQVALDRINEVLGPAAQRVQNIAALGFLSVESTSIRTLALGTVNFIAVAGDQLDLFVPSPFVAVTRKTNPLDYAIGQVTFFDRETGSIDISISIFEGDPGPHNDWTISAVAGQAIAQSTLLAQTKSARQDAVNAASVAVASQEVIEQAEAVVVARSEDVERAIAPSGAVPPANPYEGQFWFNGTALQVRKGGAWSPAALDVSSFYTKAQADAQFTNILEHKRVIARLAIEIADLKGMAVNGIGLVADAYEDESGVQLQTGGNDRFTTMLLHGEETIGSTAITDSCDNPHYTWWVYNGVTSGAQKKFGNSSYFFNGDAHMRTRGYPEPFYIAAGQDFAIDCWIYVTSISGTQVVCDFGGAGTTAHVRITLAPNGAGFSAGVAGASTTIVGGSTILALNTWHHLALTRSNNGNAMKFFINGVQEGATYTTWNGALPIHNTVTIGAYGNGSQYYMNGYIDEFRFSKGNARWTANFTPPTAPYADDTTQSNDYIYDGALDLYVPSKKRRGALIAVHADGANLSKNIVDDTGRHTLTLSNDIVLSSAQKKFGATSMLMDGTGDNFYIPGVANIADLNLTSGDFFIDCWVYISAYPASNNQGILDMRNSTSAQYAPLWYISTTGVMGWYVNNTNLLLTTETVPLNQWVHLAVQRSRFAIRFFINGVPCKNNVADGNTYSINNYVVGSYFDGTSGVAGYMDEYRHMDRAIWTQSFAVPTAPFTPDANTLVLLHGNGADGSTAITDSATTPLTTWSVLGSASVKTDQSVFGGASLKFNGSGNYIKSASATAVSLGTGNFTVECFARFSSTKTTQTLIDMRSASGTGQMVLTYEYATYSSICLYTSSAYKISANMTILPNTWYHLVVQRVNGVTSLFVDGVKVGETYTDPNNYAGQSAGIVLGTDYLGSAGSTLTGWIDELRISNVARYPDTFAVPTAPHDTSFDPMEIRSVPYSLSAVPAKVYLAVQAMPQEAITINTDLIGEVSRDNGTTWTPGVLSLISTDAAATMYGAEIDVTGQPSGSTLRYRAKTANGKNIYLSGAVAEPRAA